MPFDPLFVGGKLVASRLWRALGPRTEQRRFEAERDKQQADWVAELQQQVNRLEALVADQVEQLETAEAQQRFAAVLLRFSTEGIGSLSPRRRGLLAFSVANAVRPDFSSETLSRILRAVQALEPEDVDYLRSVSAWPPLSSFQQTPREQRKALTRGPLAVLWQPEDETDLRTAALRAALCLNEDERLTPVGRELLRFLEAWETDTGPE